MRVRVGEREKEETLYIRLYPLTYFGSIMLFVRLSLSCVCVSVGKKRRGRVMKERTRGKLDTHKPKGRRDGGRGWTMASLRTDSHFLSLLLWSSSIHSRSVVVHVCPSRDSNQMFALIESNRITKSSLVVLL